MTPVDCDFFIEFNVNCEADRLETFENCDSVEALSMDPPKLAALGFFFVEDPDLIGCAFCGFTMESVGMDDEEAIFNHHRDSPECLCDLQASHLDGYDAPPPYEVDHVNYNYRSYQSRLDTFRNWNTDTHPRPEAMAMAGFYCTGTRDGTRCFSCDLEIGSWTLSMDPFDVHREHRYVHCVHLDQVAIV